MLDIIKQNKIILIVLVVVIVGFAWFGMADRTPSTSLLSNDSRSEASVAEQEILRLLLDMRSIRLDSSIFENPAFGSLRDFGRDIVPEPVGRTNPFAPAEDSFELTEGDQAADAIFAE
ncbi:hypothetical protein CL652_02485 [bacterium]|nr:hypothetical protein [bacterium]|tara:strand:+ start:764 stop:1117 length:354 start_codon:yes stop_codon:yes gene_type:complete